MAVVGRRVVVGTVVAGIVVWKTVVVLGWKVDDASVVGGFVEGTTMSFKCKKKKKKVQHVGLISLTTTSVTLEFFFLIITHVHK